MHRLYRQHASQLGNVYVKDLSKLGRNLSKTLIIDNVADNFQLQCENGIYIKSWFGDECDDALDQLIPLLQNLTTFEDIRVGLKKIRNNILDQVRKGVERPIL